MKNEAELPKIEKNNSNFSFNKSGTSQKSINFKLRKQ